VRIVRLSVCYELSNLRTDIHRLFDLGYVTVSTGGRFEVGRRLKEDFETPPLCEMQGTLLMPGKAEQRPGTSYRAVPDM